MNSKIIPFVCATSYSVMEAIKKIDKNGYGLLHVLDNEGKLVGCITDGDIRRWIINGGKLKRSVTEAMNSSPVYITENDRSNAIALMRERGVRSVAVVDNTHHMIDVVFLVSKHRIHKNSLLSETVVVVMAGGKGTRLIPYTKILPKPLIPIGEIPILERILDRFASYGVKDIYLTVNYRKEMIKSYFTETAHEYDIHYVEESEPLGTAGSIRLIDRQFDKPVIITNCDILIEADYDDLLRYHCDSGNDLTVVSSLKNTVIPYGVIRAKENGIIIEIEEKPEISNFVNTGMYILNPEFIEWIPKGKSFHMTDLAEEMMRQGRRVGMYPISENSFFDMGEFAEMKRMEERINAGLLS